MNFSLAKRFLEKVFLRGLLDFVEVEFFFQLIRDDVVGDRRLSAAKNVSDSVSYAITL